MFEFKHIPKFCINLDRRPERWELVSKEFLKHGIKDVMRWPAVDWQNVVVPEDSRKLGEHNAAGILACSLSHKLIVQHAKESGLPYVCIFEDDVVLSSHFAHRIKYIESSHVQFDIFYLGGHDFETQELKYPCIYRIQKCGGTYAYILKHTVYDYILNTLTYEYGADEYYDYFVQRYYQALIHVPLLAGTYPNFSDIAGHTVDYKVKKVD
jgi:GR25 family glycosyltransferase involved in LPS biosynthesis